jgi:periplasmic protein CpxP/Spy
MKVNGNKITMAAVFLAMAIASPVALPQSSTGNGSGTTASQGNAGPHSGRHFGRFGWEGRAFRRLGLTDEQKTQMQQIRQDHRANMDSINQQLRSSMRELRQAYQNGTFNEALASQKLVEVAPLKAKLMAERFKMHQEMLAVLTPEQKSQLDQMRSQFKAKRAEQGGNS